jgi:O-acetyl-ADP-ribose deacetylase (regulator of RNase III)
MITFLKGDLFSDNAEALVNTVNTVGVMGKGIALAFKKAFPANFAVYQAVCKAGQLSAGQLLPVRDSNLLFGNRIIINFPTKTDWRKPSEYSYIASGLAALRKLIVDLGLKTLAMPAPGCGNGGLDWAVVKPMIVEALDGLDCDIRVYGPGG